MMVYWYTSLLKLQMTKREKMGEMHRHSCSLLSMDTGNNTTCTRQYTDNINPRKGHGRVEDILTKKYKQLQVYKYIQTRYIQNIGLACEWFS